MTYDDYGDNPGEYQRCLYKQDIEPIGYALI